MQYLQKLINDEISFKREDSTNQLHENRILLIEEIKDKII